MKRYILLTAALGALVAAAPVLAQTGTEQQERVRALVVYGADPCPSSVDDEIVVCARKPETERYRIPKDLREDAVPPSPESESWASRAESLEYIGASGIQSCTTVGPGGNTGCWQQLMRQARDERRAKERAQSSRP